MDQYLLQNSHESVGSRISWWRLGGGYTTNVDEAQIYTQAEALSQHQSREYDLPWPLSFVSPKTQLAVDCQDVIEQPLSDLPADTECYVQASRKWDGNDLYWITPKSGQSANLQNAQIFSLAEASTQFGGEANARSFVIWPKSYILSKTRRIANANTMTVSQALLNTGITLRQPKLTRRQAISCSGCGRFINEQQLWSGSCPNCDTDNRP